MNGSKERAVLEAAARRAAALKGRAGFYYKNLVTGFEYGFREDEAFLAASVIKLPIYLHVLRLAARGELDMSERLVVSEAEKQPSCGALNLFTGDVEADIATLCRLMICISDNTATNRLIRRCTIEGINRGFEEMGLEKTRLRRRLFDAEASARGLQNTICPREICGLLEKLYRGEFVNEAVSREAIDVLLKQQINHKLGGKLPEAAIAHKTGEDENLSNDAGIVYAQMPFAVCFAGYGVDVYAWESLIRETTYDLFQSVEKGADRKKIKIS